MPTIVRKRAWCSTCNDWKLFTDHKPNDEDWFCMTCENPHVSVKLSEIPKDKLLEQRERYKKRNREFFHKYLSFANPYQEIFDMLKEPGSDVEIIEADAGQKYIDEENQRARQKALAEYRENKDAAKEECIKFHNLGRNDTCACGSGKKYKKCCIERIDDLKTNYGL